MPESYSLPEIDRDYTINGRVYRCTGIAQTLNDTNGAVTVTIDFHRLYKGEYKEDVEV